MRKNSELEIIIKLDGRVLIRINEEQFEVSDTSRRETLEYFDGYV